MLCRIGHCPSALGQYLRLMWQVIGHAVFRIASDRHILDHYLTTTRPLTAGIRPLLVGLWLHKGARHSPRKRASRQASTDDEFFEAALPELHRFRLPVRARASACPLPSLLALVVRLLVCGPSRCSHDHREQLDRLYGSRVHISGDGRSSV